MNTEMVETSNDEPGPNKKRWTFPIVVVGAVVALTVVALLREPVSLDPASPEGTVQAYLQALADKDFDKALSLTTTEIQESCTAADVANNFYYDSFSATLGETSALGNVTVVEVAINQADVGIESGFFERIELTDESGSWAITGDPWPFFTYACVNG